VQDVTSERDVLQTNLGQTQSALEKSHSEIQGQPTRAAAPGTMTDLENLRRIKEGLLKQHAESLAQGVELDDTIKDVRERISAHYIARGSIRGRGRSRGRVVCR
jgi:hypothetical protein